MLQCGFTHNSHTILICCAPTADAQCAEALASSYKGFVTICSFAANIPPMRYTSIYPENRNKGLLRKSAGSLLVSSEFLLLFCKKCDKI